MEYLVNNEIKATKRLSKEIEKFPDTLIWEGEDMFTFKAVLKGPANTPYQGGEFTLKIKYPLEYPFKPPKILYAVPVFHPDIEKNGYAYISLIEDDWNPSIMIDKILAAFNQHLATVIYDDADKDWCGYNIEAFNLWRDNREEFKRIARDNTFKYAYTRED